MYYTKQIFNNESKNEKSFGPDIALEILESDNKIDRKKRINFQK